MTISQAQVSSSSRSYIFFKLTADQVMVFQLNHRLRYFSFLPRVKHKILSVTFLRFELTIYFGYGILNEWFRSPGVFNNFNDSIFNVCGAPLHLGLATYIYYSVP